jgi:hypothetical protein
MNKSQLKSYAPAARRDFIQIVRQQADILGLTKKEIEKPRVEGDIAIIEGRPYPRRHAELHARIAAKIEAEGLEQYLARIAYSWFNRFAALRFMEINGYLSHPFRVLSNRDSAKIEPEILEHAAEITLAGLDREKVIKLKLAGNQDAELYKMLLVAQCNELNTAMPFLFERINDETEILLSDNLLHSDSVIRKMVSEIDEESWKQVEIIGWLYQFYISEKKDEVIGKTVKSEDIPAATQLFTPNWIVKYMTQNSLGRLWLEANPRSSLVEKMEFYIKPSEENEPQTRGPVSPEEITILDPACGSGHILVEAYDLLKAIYTERGYSSRDIPALILEKNLFGLDIDERAAQLASFALLMKARADDRRIFEAVNAAGQNGRRDRQIPNIVTVPDSSQLGYTPEQIAEMFFSKGEERSAVPIRENSYLFEELQHQPSLMMETKRSAPVKGLQADVSEQNVIDLLELFAQGKTLGSLIRIPHGFDAVVERLEMAVGAKLASENFYEQIAARLLSPFAHAAEVLRRKYDCIIANPPYMGTKGMNSDLKAVASRNFPDSKSDLFAMFIERGTELVNRGGFNASVTMQSWMFLTSFERLRKQIIRNQRIVTMAHLGPRAFAEISGEVVQTTVFVLSNSEASSYRPTFFRLVELSEQDKVFALKKKENTYERMRQTDFSSVPGSPLAYWMTEGVRQVFKNGLPFGEIASPKLGMRTGNNERFLRRWYEVSHRKSGFRFHSAQDAAASNCKWFPYNKGGDFRKWFGNNEYLVNWENDGREIKDLVREVYPDLGDNLGWKISNESYYFAPSITWSFIGTGSFGARRSDKGFLFDVGGSSAFADEENLNLATGLLCSSLAFELLKMMNPTLNFQVVNIASLPVYKSELIEIRPVITKLVENIIAIARDDWDAFETSWDFTRLPILNLEFWKEKYGRSPVSVEEAYIWLKDLMGDRTSKMRELETENNRLFINAYGLQDELTPEVPLDQITLARADAEKDTRRLLSYFIGCQMGRYSLDEPGLIYADAGGEDFDPSRYQKFVTDADGIVPVTDIEWFPQEAARQFEAFVTTVWGEATLEENLRWVAGQLGQRAGEEALETIRRYFSSEFYKNHMQTYKKRPIYWLFSSGKQKAFEALVYLHRYNESTLPRMRHEYVLPLMSKIEARIETIAGRADEYGVRSGGLLESSGSTSERNKLEKQVETLKKKQIELAEFDEKLRHYSDMRISLDLDDGVKVNYGKFGDLLAEVKAITGSKE